MLRAQIVPRDRIAQWSQDFMPVGRNSFPCLGDRVAPPLQADSPQNRFGDHMPCLGDLMVEGVQGEQRLPPVSRREKVDQ